MDTRDSSYIRKYYAQIATHVRADGEQCEVKDVIDLVRAWQESAENAMWLKRATSLEVEHAAFDALRNTQPPINQ